MIRLMIFDASSVESPMRIVLFPVALIPKVIKLALGVISRSEKDVTSGRRRVVSYVRFPRTMISLLLVSLKAKRIHKAEYLLMMVSQKKLMINMKTLIVVIVIITHRIVFYRPCVTGKNFCLNPRRCLHVLCNLHHHQKYKLKHYSINLFKRSIKQEQKISCLIIKKNIFILLTTIKFEHVNKTKENDKRVLINKCISLLYIIELYCYISAGYYFILIT